MKTHTAPFRRASSMWRVRGLSLIELMVALVIASFITLAIFAVMSTFEARKRTTSTLNDASQAGNYALYSIDRWLRSAGSGLVQMGPDPNPLVTDRTAIAFGCRLLARNGAAAVLPLGAALPAPFASVNTTGTPGTMRMAPAIVAPEQSGGLGFGGERSDVLLVMAGAAGNGEVAMPLTGPIAANNMPVNNAVTIAQGDLLLLADQPTPGTIEDCMVQQVGTVGTPLGLSGAYAPTTVAGVSPAIYDDKSVAAKLGHPTNNPPNFLAIGVGDNATLMTYDLLRMRTPEVQAVAESVFELHAIYGVDVDDDGDVDNFVDPRATSGNFTMSNLMSGTVAAAGFIDQIKVVRVAIVLRTNLQEKAQDATDQPFTPATLTLFSDVGLPRVRNLSADERRFRYRVIESTIPLRNALLAPR